MIADLLLAVCAAALVYLCVGMTRMTRYAMREQANAFKYRALVGPVLQDQLELSLVSLEAEMREQAQRHGRHTVVAGGEGQDEQADQGKFDLEHELMVAARSDR